MCIYSALTAEVEPHHSRCDCSKTFTRWICFISVSYANSTAGFIYQIKSAEVDFNAWIKFVSIQTNYLVINRLFWNATKTKSTWENGDDLGAYCSAKWNDSSDWLLQSNPFFNIFCNIFLNKKNIQRVQNVMNTVMEQRIEIQITTKLSDEWKINPVP